MLHEISEDAVLDLMIEQFVEELVGGRRGLASNPFHQPVNGLNIHTAHSVYSGVGEQHLTQES
jgi:hypothetical protein